MEITRGVGVWGALDAVAGSMTASLQDAVRPGGKVLVYGALAGLTYSGSVAAALFKNVSIEGFWISPWLMKLDRSARREKVEEVMRLMESEAVLPHSGRTFSLSEAKAAFQEANRDGRSSDGKAMFVIPAQCMQRGFKAEL
jgi:NADPH:quinone reductase-like Zn-dependent oxidoreductase